MSDIAIGTITGRLTSDPDLNESGRVCRFSVASNYRQKRNDEWGDEVSFFTVKVLGNRAEGLAGILDQGQQVSVTGALRQERWENQEGQKRQAIVIIANEVVPGRKKGQGRRAEDDEGDDAGDDGGAPF